MFHIHFNQVPVHKNFEFKVPALTKSTQVNLEMGKCVYCLVISLMISKTLGKDQNKNLNDYIFSNDSQGSFSSFEHNRTRLRQIADQLT